MAIAISPFHHVIFLKPCHSYIKRGNLLPLLESEWVCDWHETNRMWQKWHWVTSKARSGKITTSPLITGTLVLESEQPATRPTTPRLSCFEEARRNQMRGHLVKLRSQEGRRGESETEREREVPGQAQKVQSPSALLGPTILSDCNHIRNLEPEPPSQACLKSLIHYNCETTK